MFPLSARTVLGLALATLGSRFIAALALGVLGNPQWWEYDLIAVNLWSGWGHSYERLGFVYAAYAPPLWSGLLALLLYLPGETRVSVQILQALFCLGAAVVVAILARRIGANEPASFLAGLLVALQPSLLYYSVANSDPLPLNVLLLSLILLLGADLLIHADPRRALGFGFLVGLGVLARGTPVVALPVMAMALFLRHRGAARTSSPFGEASRSVTIGENPHSVIANDPTFRWGVKQSLSRRETASVHPKRRVPRSDGNGLKWGVLERVSQQRIYGLRP